MPARCSRFPSRGQKQTDTNNRRRFLKENVRRHEVTTSWVQLAHRCPPIPTTTALLVPFATLRCRVHRHRRRRRRCRRRCRLAREATNPACFQPVPKQAVAADDRSIGGVLPGPRPLWERGCAWRCLIRSCSSGTASARPFPALAARCRARSTAWQDDTPIDPSTATREAVYGNTATAWET